MAHQLGQLTSVAHSDKIARLAAANRRLEKQVATLEADRDQLRVESEELASENARLRRDAPMDARSVEQLRTETRALETIVARQGRAIVDLAGAVQQINRRMKPRRR